MIELTVALIIFLFPLAYSPGPGNMFFAANGARFGFKKIIPAIVGYHIATWIVTFSIGFGFSEIAERYPRFFQYIGYAGSFYVLYLAWIFFNAGKVDEKNGSEKISFWDGVILLVLNPKAYVIISAMFSQFLLIDSNVKLILLITTVFTLNNLLAFSLWAYIGDRLLRQFRNERNSKILNVIFSVILAGVALWMFVKQF
ncbi:Transporter, LysE family [gamma proteobacterium IMCC1989]|nr:Transporter, LysE family [gamma proteobacterium IMCC1989]